MHIHFVDAVLIVGAQMGAFSWLWILADEGQHLALRCFIKMNSVLMAGLCLKTFQGNLSIKN